MYGLETLLRWVRTHGVADARIVGNSVRIAISYSVPHDPENAGGCDIEYVQTVWQARAVLGY